MKILEKYKEACLQFEDVFNSVHTIEAMYEQVFTTISDNKFNTPHQQQKIDRGFEVLESQKHALVRTQNSLNQKLYSQGLVLTAGAGEAILKDTFKLLIVRNVDKVRIPNPERINFSLEEFKLFVTKDGSQNESFFGEKLYEKLHDEKNPAEKLNFQNVQQIKGILNSYFGISIDDESNNLSLHKYWQMRHIIIHNTGIIDSNFIHNLTKAGISVKGYIVGEKISITKEDFNDCKECFIKFFHNLEQQILRLNLLVD